MTKAILLREIGGPEMLSWENIDVGDPGDGEIRLRQTAIGLNFQDCNRRAGRWPLPDLPIILGGEGAGVVDAVGNGVTNVSPGQRIVYMSALGGYAQDRLLPATEAFVLPDAIDDQTAAAMMVKGLTVHMLIFKSYAVGPDDTVLLHAAAGGIGSILSQWAAHLGATVIGVVSSDEKADMARANGCAHTIVSSKENFAERVTEITGGTGVQVVYDSIGRDTFDGSMDSLENFGTLVSFGAASGPVPPIETSTLMQKGSLNLTRPTVMQYIANRTFLEKAVNDLFDVVASGKIKIDVGQTYPLAEAARAHADMEARKTHGSTVLLP